ncbi:hypothetical protein AC792_02450 [Arthrobacter sp. RIT-PI-e]|nr:hypothetical protein AC792_02450 [Arthrobacter sp. RIT-PI-e]
MTAALTGFATCLALLTSLGAQNLLLIRHGMQRHRPGLVAGVFLASDVGLVVLGVLGVAGAPAAAPLPREVLTVPGAGFLFWLAVGAARRARTLRARSRRTPAVAGAALTVAPSTPAEGAEPDHPEADGPARRRGAWAVAGTAVAVTWLNPQVLLETMFVLGTAGSSHGASGRWWVVAGSVLASTVWFCGIGYAARSLAGLLQRAPIWYVLEVVPAVVMLGIGVGLLRSLW